MKLESQRLILAPMTVEELEQKLQKMTDPELHKAYSEMLDGCRSNPDAFLWYTPWQISLKTDGTAIGDAVFKAAPQEGCVEIGYGIEEPYWGKGYMTEAAQTLIDWAFQQAGCCIVEAETEAHNLASQRVLQKLGFTPCGVGEEGPRFRLPKP